MAVSKRALQRKTEKLLLDWAERNGADVDNDQVIEVVSGLATTFATTVVRSEAGEPVKRTRGSAA